MHTQESFWKRGLIAGVIGLAFLFVAAIWAFAATGASAQAEGEERVRQGEGTFQQICVSCHTIGEGVRVGPDLQGVTERREDAWLRVHIQSPSVHQAQNDPLAVANRERFGFPMPDLGLTEQQVEAVIAYLHTGEKASLATPALYAPTIAVGVLVIVALTFLGLRVGTKRVEIRP